MIKYDKVLLPGTVLRGKQYGYRIDRVLGQGTFGITYLASVQIAGELGSVQTEALVAVKEFFMGDINGREGSTVTTGGSRELFDQYRHKFVREARSLSKLKHPGIVKVVETFDANETSYYVMEYCSGGSLDALIVRQGGIPQGEALALFGQMASALAYMHSRRMLHLDLKPGNVMLRGDGRAVLIDFGLAKQFNEKGDPESSTTIGGGTPGYAPIEQADYNEEKRGKRNPMTMDIYALGATLYKMLTGERPPKASDVNIDGLPEQPLREHGVSSNVEAAIRRAMSPKPGDRYQTVADFAAAIEVAPHDEDGGTHKSDETQHDDEVEEVILVDDGKGGSGASSNGNGGNNFKSNPDEHIQEGQQEFDKGVAQEVKPKSKGVRNKLKIFAIALVVVFVLVVGIWLIKPVIVKSQYKSYLADIEMVYVDGGTFIMGATSEQGSDALADEKPAHSVTLDGYYIGKYEVTQAQWKAVMGSNPSYFEGDNLPVENVSWDDVQEFIRKLNQLTGKSYRLPTEAEWEYAARGGGNSRGYKYSGSDNIGSVAWYGVNSGEKTHPVGSKSANELGIYDMSGNVWEWCQDWYGSDYYSSSPQRNPQGPNSGSCRVYRGGGWFVNARYCRVSRRIIGTPDYRGDNLGFRLAL